MKTFEEAARIFYREIDVTKQDDVQEITEIQTAELNESIELRRSMINELTESPICISLAKGMIDGYRSPCKGSILCLVVHGLAHGVAIGIEMEKGDFPSFEE